MDDEERAVRPASRVVPSRRSPGSGATARCSGARRAAVRSRQAESSARPLRRRADEDRATGAGAHAQAEAVGLGPPTVVRLERALAHRSAPNGGASGPGQAWGPAIRSVARCGACGRGAVRAATRAGRPPPDAGAPRGAPACGGGRRRTARARDVGPSTVRGVAREGQTATASRDRAICVRGREPPILPTERRTAAGQRHADRPGSPWQTPRRACGQPLDGGRGARDYGRATTRRVRSAAPHGGSRLAPGAVPARPFHTCGRACGRRDPSPTARPAAAHDARPGTAHDDARRGD